MPADREAPQTILEMLQGRMRAIVEILEAYVDGPTGPSDPAAAATAIGLITNQLLTTIPALGAAAVKDLEDRFIVGDHEKPSPDQSTLGTFTAAVAAGLAQAGLIPQAAVGPAGKLLASTATAVGLDPDTWLRWTLGLQGKVTAVMAQDKLQAALIDLAIPYGETMYSEVGEPLPEDFPSYDDVKEADFIEGTVPAGVSAVLKWVTARITGGTSASDRKVGQAVHKALMAEYVAAYPTHFVIADGRAQIKIGPKNSLAVSRLMSVSPDTWPPAAPNRAKVSNYWDVMKDPDTTPPKRIRPDIADLNDAAQGTDPRDSWGWFEIKPMHALGRAYQELFFYYMRRWNNSPKVKMEHPQWQAKPGAWQPQLVGVLPTVQPMRVYGALTAPPGCIGYLSVEIKAAGEAAAMAYVTTALANLLAKKVFSALRDLYGDTDAALEPVLLLLGFVLIAVVLYVLAEALIIIVPFAAIAGFLGLAESANLQQQLQRLAAP
jgi:hypothetical protein